MTKKIGVLLLTAAMPSLNFFSRFAILSFITAMSILWFNAELRSAGAVKAPGVHDEVPLATDTRLLEPGWWPTKVGAARAEYVGLAGCARCHADKTESYAATQMAHAMAPVTSEKLPELSRGPLRRHIGSLTYELSQSPAGAVYSASDGTNIVSAPINWVFGVGEIGRTYVYQQNSVFYESHMSYYTGPQILDVTTGHTVSGSLASALGRPITDPRVCFGCHSTEATTSDHFDPQEMVPGVTCEACHGPGAQHVALMSTAQGGQGPSMIFNPARLGPVTSVDFCGACHRTSVDVAFLDIRGLFTLRFPAYRLEGSRCWTKPDARLTCFACHDPHQPLVRETSSYDKNCVACHNGVIRTRTGLSKGTGASARVASALPTCPVAKTDCVTCHMPQYRVDQMHAIFTDHRIAIHRERTVSAR